jgi:hypothetical protein
MAKSSSTGAGSKVSLNRTVGKGTTIGAGLRKSSTLNKHKKRSYKAYRGQGR